MFKCVCKPPIVQQYIFGILLLGNEELTLHFVQRMIGCALNGIITDLKLVILDGKLPFP
jgi:hypothetical protein